MGSCMTEAGLSPLCFLLLLGLWVTTRGGVWSLVSESLVLSPISTTCWRGTSLLPLSPISHLGSQKCQIGGGKDVLEGSADDLWLVC